VVGGQLIHSFTGWGHSEYGFAAAFLIATIARWWGGRIFAQVEDPPIHVPDDSKFTFWQFISRARQSNFVKFVLFVSFMNFAVAISGPYFAMYMLNDLKLSYLEYMCVVATGVLIQFVVMRSWGALSDQFGNRKILRVCGWLVAFNPWMWLISDNLVFLIFIQLYSGFFWSGFNLAAANFVFDAVTPAKRARCIAYQAIVNGVLVFIGSLIGGVMAMNMPDILTRSLSWFVPSSPFLALFLLSGVLRAITMAFLYPAFREVRAVQRIRGHELLVRVTTLRPLWGATYGFVNQRRGRKAH
jgi:MFS family permease